MISIFLSALLSKKDYLCILLMQCPNLQVSTPIREGPLTLFKERKLYGIRYGPNPLASLCLRVQGPELSWGPFQVEVQYKVEVQPISPHKVTKLGVQCQVRTWIEENDNALGGFTCQAPFGDGCKFQESRVSYKKWVPLVRNMSQRDPPTQKTTPSS